LTQGAKYNLLTCKQSGGMIGFSLMTDKRENLTLEFSNIANSDTKGDHDYYDKGLKVASATRIVSQSSKIKGH
jgi:hypothetical protein